MKKNVVYFCIIPTCVAENPLDSELKCFYNNSIAVPFPYMVAGVGRAVQDVVGQEKSEKSPENRAKKLANGSDVWYTNPCVTALLICDDAGGGRRVAVTTAAQTGNFRGVCPI